MNRTMDEKEELVKKALFNFVRKQVPTAQLRYKLKYFEFSKYFLPPAIRMCIKDGSKSKVFYFLLQLLFTICAQMKLIVLKCIYNDYFSISFQYLQYLLSLRED